MKMALDSNSKRHYSKRKWGTLSVFPLALPFFTLYACVGHANEFLTADIMESMRKGYVELCVSNTNKLAKELHDNHVKVGERATNYDWYKQFVTCEPISDDSLYISLQDPIVNQRVDGVIKRKGIPRYILDTKNSLSETRKKYHIDEYEKRMRDDHKLTIDELATLVQFAKASARSGAVINILRKLN